MRERGSTVGQAMANIGRDTEVAQTMFEILETQRIVEGDCNLTLLRMPAHGLLAELLAAESGAAQASTRTPSASPREGLAALPKTVPAA